jgi:pimeloyl-ACP methyl ester carboxylesterase
MIEPETRYARSGEHNIAYQVIGDGPRDLVFIDQWFSNVELQWEFPPLARFLRRLSSFARLIVFDKRGTGLSDPVGVRAMPTMEEWMDDLRAVLDAVGSERADLAACVAGGYMTMLFSATYPERTSALVLIDAFARALRDDDYSGLDPAVLAENAATFEREWGQGVTLRFLGPASFEDDDVRPDSPSGLRFDERGEYDLKGVPGRWGILAVASAGSRADRPK